MHAGCELLAKNQNSASANRMKHAKKLTSLKHSAKSQTVIQNTPGRGQRNGKTLRQTNNDRFKTRGIYLWVIIALMSASIRCGPLWAVDCATSHQHDTDKMAPQQAQRSSSSGGSWRMD